MRNFSGRADDQGNAQLNDKKTEELLSIIRDKELRKTDPNLVAKAITQLGQRRALESVDDLAGLLAFSQSLNADRSDAERIQEIHPVAPSERYPAAGALIKIGQASLPALFRVIESNETGSLESDNATFAVSMIFREDPEHGVAQLHAAASASSNHTSMSRLQAAADKLDKVAKSLKESN